uniref:Uncharacterized protein n=1 Tax=viral metagenome TaxID=1070528 RepID=A0A6M3IHV6_9ZZZZ
MVKVELVIIDAKGQKHTIPTQQLPDTKNFHKFGIAENSAGVVGSMFLPIAKKNKTAQTAKAAKK